MNNFLFENRTRFLFGGGCVKEYLASFLTGYGPSVLLVREEGDSRSGAVDEVRDILRRSGKQVAECAVGPFCPRYEQVRQAARLCRERRVDLMLGVGGSAVLDGCKAAALAAVCRGELWENYGALQGVVDVPPLSVGFVASHLEVGAVNGAAGLIYENQCVWRDYPPCDPCFALLDPACTQELSRRELIFQGFSALAGALEEYLPPRLGTDHIDLYFQHRMDPGVEPETVAQVMADLIREARSPTGAFPRQTGITCAGPTRCVR